MRTRQTRYLNEEAEPGEDLYGLEKMSNKTRQALDSVDDQVDSFLIKYESESIKNSSEDEIIMEALRSMSLRFLLEAEGDDPAEPSDDAGGEGPPSPPVGSETPKEEPESVDPKPPLDIDAFTKKLARLIMNYRSLLRVEPVIVNRASAFLEKNYGKEGKDYVDRMIDILDTQFDFNLEGEEDVIDVPIAAGAAGKSAGG
jgi:hypothetical protein